MTRSASHCRRCEPCKHCKTGEVRIYKESFSRKRLGCQGPPEVFLSAMDDRVFGGVPIFAPVIGPLANTDLAHATVHLGFEGFQKSGIFLGEVL